MPQSYNRIWIHAIWATKKRQPLIIPAIEKQLHTYMSVQFIESGCPVRIINGMPDHVHCLFLLSPQKSISEVIKQVKGSSSHYVNEQYLAAEKFAWQTGYAAYSVCQSQLEKVFVYIKNQKSRHARQSYQREFDAFLKLYGWEDS